MAPQHHHKLYVQLCLLTYCKDNNYGIRRGETQTACSTEQHKSTRLKARHVMVGTCTLLNMSPVTSISSSSQVSTCVQKPVTPQNSQYSRPPVKRQKKKSDRTIRFHYGQPALGKGKIHPWTDHKGPEGEQRYNSALSLTSALNGGGWSAPRPGRFTPGKDPVPTV